MPSIRTISVSGSIPSITQLALGDLAVNTFDGKAYLKKQQGTTQTVIEIGSGGGATSGVTQIIAGTNITISPTGGTGIVTINAGTPVSASYALSASYAATASYAQTASYATNFKVSGSITDVDYIDFDTAATVTQPVAGRLSWNNTDGTLDLGLKGSNVTLQIGQENTIRIVNKTGADLLEADFYVVRVRSVAEGGAQGQRLAVKLAQADSDADSATTLGVVTENIGNNQEGFITIFGEVRSIDTTGAKSYGGTETWVDGDMLYLSPFYPGYLTNVKPTAPNHLVIVGYVVYAHQNNGKIFVKIDNGWEIGELHDVKDTTTTSSYGDLLVKSGSVWTNSRSLTGSYSITGSLSTSGSILISTGSLQITNYITTASRTSTYTTNQINLQGYYSSNVNNADIVLQSDLYIRAYGSVNRTILENNSGITLTNYSGTANNYLHANSTGVVIGGTNQTILAKLHVKGSGTTSATTAFRIENANASASLAVLDNGNVGIGTTAPTYKLHISSSNNNDGLAIHYIANNSTLFPFIISTNADSAGNYIRVNAQIIELRRNGAASTIKTVGSSNTLALESNSDLSLSTNGANTRMYIDTSGNVGIGTTTQTSRLQVKGSGTTSATTSLLVQNANASSSLVVLDNGNIGFGTTTPTQKIHSVASGDIYSFIQSTGTGAAGNIYKNTYREYFTGTNYATANSWEVYDLTAGAPVIHVSGPSRAVGINKVNAAYQLDVEGALRSTGTSFLATAGGFVGIGTTTPATLLDVRGSGRFTGGLTVTGSIIATQNLTLGTNGKIASGDFANPVGNNSVAIGYSAVAAANNSMVVGFISDTDSGADYSAAIGYEARSYLPGQVSYAYGNHTFNARDAGAQQSFITVKNSAGLTTGATMDLSIGGNLITLLGSSRAWMVTMDWIASVSSISGTATGVTVGDTAGGTIRAVVKKVGGVLSIVGIIANDKAADASLSAVAMTFVAGGSANLIPRFTGPTFAGGGTVTMKVVGGIKLSETGI